MLLLTNTTSIVVRPLYPPRPVQFSILLAVMVVSIPCFVFVLFHVLTDRTLCKALNNHAIILLLLFNALQTLTDLPVHLAYYWTGIIWPPSVYYCYFRFFIDYYLFTTSFLLLTWASFERHILIFRAQLFNTPLRRLLGHYIPLALCCVYPLLYYLVFFFLYPCENYYDVTVANCVTPCFLWVSSIMALYEQIAHGFTPMLLITFFNILLIIRVLQQKHRHGRRLVWARNRRMTVQLLSICILFFVTNSGYFIIQLGRLLDSEDFGRSVASWIFPLSLCMPPLVSYVCLGMLHDLKQKLRMVMLCARPTAVAPTVPNGPQAAQLAAMQMNIVRTRRGD